MSGERWRCFVALPIGGALRSALAVAVADWRLRPDLDRLRWVEPAAWHLTLEFLGDVDPANVPRILSSLEGCAAGQEAFRVATRGVGGFPAHARARVAWCGVDDGADQLVRLADAVRRSLGFDAVRSGRPHITVARTRSGSIDLRAWVAKASAPVGELAVDRLELFRSHLAAGSTRYESLGSARLGIPARV